MKKKYSFSIFGISFLMISAVVIYGARFADKNGINLNEFIMNNLLNVGTTQISDEKQDSTENTLGGTSYVQPQTAKKAIRTSTGYEGLSTDVERKCYNLIKSNASKILNTEKKPGLYSIQSFTVTGGRLTPAQIKKVLYAVQNDNPDIFWIASSFSYCYSGNRTTLKLTSMFSPNEQKKALKQLNNKVNSIISQAPTNANEYELELFFHDYIVKNCKYQNVNALKVQNMKIFTCYGCLVENAAVCEGMAKSMQLLLNSVGIKCGTVVGSRGTEPHMWNIVKINNHWYHLDVTWDTGGEFQKYNYFNLTEEMIKKDHKINEQLKKTTAFNDNVRYNFEIPACNSTEYNYYERNALKIRNFNSDTNNQIVKKLISSAKSKNEYFYIKFDKNISLTTAKNDLLIKQPYRFFTCIKSANQSLDRNHKINDSQVKYSGNSFQNVLIIKLSYK